MPARGGGPAVHPPPAPAACAARGSRKVVLCLGYLGEQVVEAVGDGSAFGLEVAYSFDGPELRGTAGAIRRALPLLGEAFFVLYGDSYLECDYAAVQARLRGRGQAGADDRLPQRGAVGHEQRRVPRRPHPGLRQGQRAPRRCITSTTAWASWTGGRCDVVPETGAVRPGVGLPGDAPPRRAGRVRGDRTVLRDRLGRGARRDARPPGRATRFDEASSPGGDHVARGAVPRRGQAGHRRPGRRGHRADGDAAGADPRARRTAVHPGRRRQRRQRLARRQRLPQDRRHRGLRPDRQRLGADGADQRRGLGRRSSWSGCASAGSSPRT